MKKKALYFFFLIASLSLTSCAELFNGTVLPNQCKKCELFNTYRHEKIWEVEGCGSENTKLEQKCKDKAWELSRGQHLGDYEYKCKSWRKKKEQ